MEESDLRDFYAGLAMLGAVSHAGFMVPADEISDFAYKMADSMIGQRNSEKEPEEGIVGVIKKRRKKEA